MNPDTVLRIGAAVLVVAIILVGVLLPEYRLAPEPYDPHEAYERADPFHHDYRDPPAPVEAWLVAGGHGRRAFGVRVEPCGECRQTLPADHQCTRGAA